VERMQSMMDHGRTDRERGRSEPDGELVARLLRVLEWIAEGNPRRVDDYARIASDTVEEVQALRFAGHDRRLQAEPHR
jgi:hypothetical protein